jgi:D-3-phosphoglycerate dehydrogenase
MPVIEQYREELENAGCEVVVAKVRERLTEDELLELVGNIDGIICGDDQITDRVLAAAPRLKVISKWGTGIDSIDQEAAVRRGIAIRNTPNAFSEPVADTVFGYILLFARRLDVMNRDIRAGRWVKPQLMSLREQTLGVIGVGNCGKAVVRRAVAFGIRVLGNDLVKMPSVFLTETGIEMVLRDELLQQSDFVTLHTSLNPTSYHLIDEKALALMKPSAYLINTARGPVIEEEALVRALERGQIAGAALDVFENEPLPLESPLRRFENVWFAPHNANSSPSAARRVHENTIRNLIEELQRRS